MCGADESEQENVTVDSLLGKNNVWFQDELQDGYDGARAASSPYSPKTNLFSSCEDPLALLEALELGAADGIMTSEAAIAPTPAGEERRCILRWDGAKSCAMFEQHDGGRESFVLRATFCRGVFYISENEAPTKPLSEEEEIAVAIAAVQMGNGRPFRIYSRGCRACKRFGCYEQASPIRGSQMKAPAEKGWAWSLLESAWDGRGIGWEPREQLAEIAHSKELMHPASSTQAHVMAVELPLSNSRDNRGPTAVTWCPRNPRQTDANDALILENRLPTWNKKSRTMVLDFSGRVKKASAKNFQLCVKGKQDKSSVVLQYGKVEDERYILDFKGPLSAIQALGIALTVKGWA